MPRQWWPTVESAGAVIDNQGVWPAPAPQSNGRFTPLDVDRHHKLAIVVGYGPTRLKGELALGVDEFHEWKSVVEPPRRSGVRDSVGTTSTTSRAKPRAAAPPGW